MMLYGLLSFVLVAMAVLVIVIAVLFTHAWLVYRRSARKILNDGRALWSKPHDYRLVNYLDYPTLDLAFYQRETERFASLGYVWVGDVEDFTLSALYPRNSRTVLRAMTHPTEGKAVWIWHSQIAAMEGNPPREFVKDCPTVELGVGYDDGTRLATGPRQGAEMLQPYPFIKQEWVPPGTTVDEMVAAHERACEAFEAANPDRRRVVPPSNSDELLHLLGELDERKFAFRKSIGWFSDEEILRMGEKADPSHVKAVLRHIRHLREKELRAEHATK